VAASSVCGEDSRFREGDTSAKLKRFGIDVSTFGTREGKALVFQDEIAGSYKKLFFRDGPRLCGGILVGDTSACQSLKMPWKAQRPVADPSSLLASKSEQPTAIGDEDQVCSCNDVTKGQICCAVEEGCTSLEELAEKTRAGTGCGGCKPTVKVILDEKMKALGRETDRSLCKHFRFSRRELLDIVKVKGIRTFRSLIESSGRGVGCAVCKPAVASILASIWNDFILTEDNAPIQDTNDRFLANIQKGGSYSVVPRVPGGEITPRKLQVLGQGAEEYGLYTKITGGQRVDLFGAAKHELPAIWKRLIDAGFESGHAYGKAMRTVKSCVGSSWCRYGMRDSVGLAVTLENRYKGIRSPHKIKGGVSGCIRECAEARCKDFGLIAVEGGYNLFVCGNGGARPRHGDLLASSIVEKDCIRYIDRFIAFYILTADRLQRTARWLESLDGGIGYLRAVVVEDSLSIAADLEKHIASLISTYKCEWREVVEDPAKQRLFLDPAKQRPSLQYADRVPKPAETGRGEGFETVRGQKRPLAWPVGDVSVRRGKLPTEWKWLYMVDEVDVPRDSGISVGHGGIKIAIFNFHSLGGWYATQNRCPHKGEEVLSQGLLECDGSGANPTVVCPMHKRVFQLDDTDDSLARFEVKAVEGRIWLRLPDIDDLRDYVSGEKPCTCKELEW